MACRCRKAIGLLAAQEPTQILAWGSRIVPMSAARAVARTWPLFMHEMWFCLRSLPFASCVQFVRPVASRLDLTLVMGWLDSSSRIQ